MTKDEILEMAKEAAFELSMWQLSVGCDVWGTHKELERFAALVAEKEREACALLLEENVQECNGPMGFVLQSNADAIRARGNT